MPFKKTWLDNIRFGKGAGIHPHWFTCRHKWTSTVALGQLKCSVQQVSRRSWEWICVQLDFKSLCFRLASVKQYSLSTGEGCNCPQYSHSVLFRYTFRSFPNPPTHSADVSRVNAPYCMSYPEGRVCKHLEGQIKSRISIVFEVGGTRGFGWHLPLSAVGL